MVNLLDVSLNVNTCVGVMSLHLLNCEQLVSVNQTIRFQPDHRKDPQLLPQSGRSLSPQICSLLQKLVVLKPVRVGPVLVDNLLKVGKPLPVEPGDLLVPEPVGIVWNVGQGSVAADLQGNHS